MRTLSIDIETFSDVNLSKSGVYPYAASPKFQILLFAYCFDDEEIKIIDIARGEKLTEEITKALLDENTIKTAFNAQFERICLSKHLGKTLSPKSWHCTLIRGAALGLPLSLEETAGVLGLKEQKLKEGKNLIKFFSTPSPKRISPQNAPKDHLDKWETFKTYCKQDVAVERELRKKLKKYPLSQTEQNIYSLDQAINDRGVLVDMPLVTKAIECDRLFKARAITKAKGITGLHNPNSIPQLKKWLHEQGIEVDSLSKKAVSSLIKETTGEIKELLQLRLLLSKTSIKKYEAIQRAVSPDGRVRGLFQFYGASRTGRWAGRLVQVQNLPQNHIKDLDLARNLLKSGDYDTLELLYGSVPPVLSELIRTAFIPKPNHRFLTADFSAIEARIIAWLAREHWRLQVFSTHGKIYEASASQMFRIPIEEITKNSPLRQKGKIAELALGYGGSTGALRAMGALDMGLQEKELGNLVTAWRQSNPNITKLWWDVDKAAARAVKEKINTTIGPIKIHTDQGLLRITLPSGRKLSYIRPRIEKNKFGRDGITYEGISPAKKWERIETYGPKLVENIVQGAARDILAESMERVSKRGYKIVMHCHDEIIAEVPKDFGSIKELCDLMAIPPTWAKDLPLQVEGFESEYYKKS